MRAMTSDTDYLHRMLQTVAVVTATVVLLIALYEARAALMLIYISALIAMGFAPLVRMIQQPSKGNGKGVPRTLAILVVYLVIVGLFVAVALIVVPALISQAEALWAQVPSIFNDFQNWMIRYRLMTRKVTLQE